MFPLRTKTLQTKTYTLLACQVVILLSILIGTLSLPNDKPFLSVWNSPTQGCEKFGLNLSYFDIIINRDGAFQGNNSIIFYNFGKFPFYDKGAAVNGGLPQLGNVTMNNDEIKKLVNTSIPNEHFNGIAVFDWERWSPLYAWTGGLYQRKSDELVEKKHPTWNATQVHYESVKEYDFGAEQFMGGTVNLSRRMRPKGYWGYYAYPTCILTHNGTRCDTGSMKNNDRLAYLYAGSTGYFPRIYLPGHELSYPWITAIIKESLRVRALYGAPWTEIMPYSAYIMGKHKQYYIKQDLDVSVKQSADAGAGGIVFWGSSGNVQTKQDCLDLVKYVDTVLGPYVKALTNFVEQCSLKLCSNHGRCVVPDISNINYRAQKKREENDYSGYICQCYYEWSGTHCEKSAAKKRRR